MTDDLYYSLQVDHSTTLQVVIVILWFFFGMSLGKTIESFVHKWPGRKTFGIFRFMPLFFFLGATLEFAMINWRPMGVNFYDIYQKKEAKKIAEEALQEEKL